MNDAITLSQETVNHLRSVLDLQLDEQDVSESSKNELVLLWGMIDDAVNTGRKLRVSLD